MFTPKAPLPGAVEWLLGNGEPDLRRCASTQGRAPDQPPLDVVEIDTIALSMAPAPTAGSVSVNAEYTFRAPAKGPDVLSLTNGEYLTVERAATSPFTDVTTSHHSGNGLIRIPRPTGRGFDGARLTLLLRWDSGSVERLNGSPIVVAPAYLPQPATVHGPFYDDAFPRPTGAAEMIRMSAPPELLELAGSVADAHGRPLMLAAPFDARFREQVWHTDDALVLGGELLRSFGEARRQAIVNRLLEIHRHFDAEFGRGDRVRLLAVYDANSPEYARRRNDYSALGEKDLVVDSAGVFKGERLMAEHLASLWWSSGLRPAGLDGPTLSMALATYAVIRWFDASGRRSRLSRELEVMQGFKQRIERAGIASDRAMWRVAALTLALYDASTRGIPVCDELRRWCAQDWGKAVAVDTLIDRLVAIGVKVMW